MSTMKPKYIVLNSNLMIPYFPHSMKIRLAPLKKKFCCILTLQRQDATKNVFDGANLNFIL